MRINQNNNNQPSFKSINVIQIKKSTFKHPDNLVEIENGVNDIFHMMTGEISGKSSGFFERIGLSKSKAKFYSYLEQPRYVQIVESLKKMGGYSINWLSQNKKISIREPINEDYHSFFVYTDKHKDICLNIDKSVNRYAKNPKNTPVELNQYFIQELAKNMGEDKINYYRVEQLTQLPYVFNKIGL